MKQYHTPFLLNAQPTLLITYTHLSSFLIPFTSSLVPVMSIAFFHCRVMPWGALAVLKNLIENEHFTSARIFCLVSDRKSLAVAGQDIPVTTAFPRWLNKLCTSFFDYRNLIVLFPFLTWVLGKKAVYFPAKKIIISSFAIAKNIPFDRSIPNFLYLHSPMQYIRTHHQDYTKKISWRKGRIFRTITTRLQKRDTKPRMFKKIIANSIYTKKCAEKIYGRKNIQVKYPPISPLFLNTGVCPPHLVKNYFVFVGRIATMIKEVDKLITLCNATQTNLLVLGSWPDELYCKKIAGPTITFCGRVSPEEQVRILTCARGLLNITKESFWLVTAHALCLGVPVFGLDAGATPELVDAQSGILITKKDPKSLIAAFTTFKEKNRDRNYIKTRVMQLLT